jgi:copper chaperone CopZ
MKSSDLSIQGMNCQHCVAAVKKELEKIPTLTLKDVQIGSASVSYDEHHVNETTLRDAVNNAGFTLISVH